MNKVTFIPLLSLVVLLAGCNLLEPQQPGVSVIRSNTPASADRPRAAETEELAPLQPALYPGTDTAVSMPAARPPVRLEGEAVTLNFEEAPLADVVHAILGDTLGLDYVVEHPIDGTVTLRTRSPIPRDQLLPILESLLQSNGALMVRDPNDRYFVSASPNVAALSPSFSNPQSQGAGYSNVIVPLSYIGAREMSEILRPVAPEAAFVRIDTNRNLLVLAGTRNQVSGWMDIISTFDVDQLAGMSVGIFPLDNSLAEDINTALGELLGTAGEGEQATSTPLAGLVRVVPIERLNSILVVSPRAHYIDQIRTWIERLDQAQSSSGEPTLYIYPVQNGNAVQMAELLSGIFGGRGNASAGSGNQNSGVAPGLSQMSTGADSGMPDTGSDQQNRGGNFDLGDNIRVVADNFNNALLIYAPRQEYTKIRNALERLDIVPTQVLIEASIVEVTLSDDLEFGVEWTFRDNFSNGRNGTGTLNLGDSNSIGPNIPGFSYSLTDNAGAVRAVINTLAEKSLVNVLSTPSIMVQDNHTAAIHVGDQQPVQSAIQMSEIGTTTSIEYRDTGVKLQVTPSVNAGDLVTMDILQSVTDVGPIDPATRQRSFLERNVSSRIAVRSGESVVLGGLIRDNASRGRAGLPILQDIPVLGHLFGRTTNNSSRTELLVFITPRVLRNEQDLRDISVEMRARMQGLQHFADLPAAIGVETIQP